MALKACQRYRKVINISQILCDKEVKLLLMAYLGVYDDKLKTMGYNSDILRTEYAVRFCNQEYKYKTLENFRFENQDYHQTEKIKNQIKMLAQNTADTDQIKIIYVNHETLTTTCRCWCCMADKLSSQFVVFYEDHKQLKLFVISVFESYGEYEGYCDDPVLRTDLTISFRDIITRFGTVAMTLHSIISSEALINAI